VTITPPISRCLAPRSEGVRGCARCAEQPRGHRFGGLHQPRARMASRNLSSTGLGLMVNVLRHFLAARRHVQGACGPKADTAILQQTLAAGAGGHTLGAAIMSAEIAGPMSARWRGAPGVSRHAAWGVLGSLAIFFITDVPLPNEGPDRLIGHRRELPEGCRKALAKSSNSLISRGSGKILAVKTIN